MDKLLRSFAMLLLPSGSHGSDDVSCVDEEVKSERLVRQCYIMLHL